MVTPFVNTCLKFCSSSLVHICKAYKKRGHQERAWGFVVLFCAMKLSEKVNKIREAFPKVTEEQAQWYLSENNNDLQLVFAMLVEEPKWHVQKPKSTKKVLPEAPSKPTNDHPPKHQRDPRSDERRDRRREGNARDPGKHGARREEDKKLAPDDAPQAPASSKPVIVQVQARGSMVTRGVSYADRARMKPQPTPPPQTQPPHSAEPEKKQQEEEEEEEVINVGAAKVDREKEEGQNDLSAGAIQKEMPTAIDAKPPTNNANMTTAMPPAIPPKESEPEKQHKSPQPQFSPPSPLSTKDSEAVHTAVAPPHTHAAASLPTDVPRTQTPRQEALPRRRVVTQSEYEKQQDDLLLPLHIVSRATPTITFSNVPGQPPQKPEPANPVPAVYERFPQQSVIPASRPPPSFQYAAAPLGAARATDWVVDAVHNSSGAPQAPQPYPQPAAPQQGFVGAKPWIQAAPTARYADASFGVPSAQYYPRQQPAQDPSWPRRQQAWPHPYHAPNVQYGDPNRNRYANEDLYPQTNYTAPPQLPPSSTAQGGPNSHADQQMW